MEFEINSNLIKHEIFLCIDIDWIYLLLCKCAKVTVWQVNSNNDCTYLDQRTMAPSTMMVKLNRMRKELRKMRKERRRKTMELRTMRMRLRMKMTELSMKTMKLRMKRREQRMKTMVLRMMMMEL